MAIDRFKPALIALPLLALAACTGTGSMQLGAQPDNFGEANRQTFAAQVINPNPVYAESYVGGSAEKAAQAIERYRTDRVKQPERQNITSVGSGSSSSGAARSGGN